MVDYPVQLRDLLETQDAVPVKVEGDGKHRCPNCGDLGTLYAFKVEAGPFMQPAGRGSKFLLDYDGRGPGWYKGHLEAAPCPACGSSRLVDWFTSKCGLSGSDLTVTLSQFKPEEGKGPARETAAGLLAMNRKPSGFVTFHGMYGTGKSMLLKALVNGFRLMEVYAVYSSLADLLASIRAKFGEENNSAEQMLDSLRDVRVLCVDEVEKANLTPWAWETVQRLMDSRYNERDCLLTVMASNVPPWKLPNELQYLGSRMTGGVVVEVGGQDMRPVVGWAERNI